MKKRIYIIGKVTGLPQKEVTNKFSISAQILRGMGFIPINPIEVVNDWKADWNTAMRLCIRQLMTADAVYVHRDADQSRGATLELAICTALELPQFITYDGILKHFGMYPASKCTHPEPHEVKVVGNLNCDTIIKICRECSSELSTETDCR